MTQRANESVGHTDQIDTIMRHWRDGDGRRCSICSREHGPVQERDLPKIGAPATRALASIGVTRLDQVVDHSTAELLALHGFGPRALRILSDALAANGQALRP